MRVLFTANPGFGHVHPMMPLAQALAANRAARRLAGEIEDMPGPDEVAGALEGLT